MLNVNRLSLVKPSCGCRFARQPCFIFLCWLGLLAAQSNAQSDPGIPHLRKQGTATQLVVDGTPFLLLAGELEEETSTSLDNLRSVWPTLVQMNLNTVLPVVYWGLLEPEEGKFDFALVDGIIQEARRNQLRIGLVWFASWKNGLSIYAPHWVMKDYKRFPRARLRDGTGLQMFSSIEGYSGATRDADARAFAALMRHIKEVDGQQHSVIMVQVENEVGMAGDSRDHSPAADKAFAGPVPKELMDYLQQNKDTLIPEFRRVWELGGFKTSGTWEEVFGANLATDEIFEAWHYSRFVGRVAQAGKAEYSIPMYVNAALHRSSTIADAVGKERTGGGFAFGGPMDDMIDIWRVGAPAIDMLSPDCYNNIVSSCRNYDRSGNPLFIAEASGGAGGAANVLYAVGRSAIGSSVYGIEFNLMRNDPANELGRIYRAIGQLMPLIGEHQGRNTMAGVLLQEKSQVENVPLGDYTMSVGFGHDRRPGGAARAPAVWRGGALFLMTSPEDLYVIASNDIEIAVTFTPNTPGPKLVGVSMVEEGSFVDGRWVLGRSYVDHRTSNNDAPLLLPAAFHRIDAHSEHSILRVKLYRWE